MDAVFKTTVLDGMSRHNRIQSIDMDDGTRVYKGVTLANAADVCAFAKTVDRNVKVKFNAEAKTMAICVTKSSFKAADLPGLSAESVAIILQEKEQVQKGRQLTTRIINVSEIDAMFLSRILADNTVLRVLLKTPNVLSIVSGNAPFRAMQAGQSYEGDDGRSSAGTRAAEARWVQEYALVCFKIQAKRRKTKTKSWWA